MDVDESEINTDMTLNDTELYQNELSVISFTINLLIAVFTVALNLVIVVCLRTHRNSIPDVLSQQLMSLSISNALAGLAPALLCLTFSESVHRNNLACQVIPILFNIMQYATLLNLCILYARSWFVLRKSLFSTAISYKKQVTILCFITAWLVSSIFYIPCALFMFSRKHDIQGCLSPELIANPNATVLMIIVLPVCTLLLLNFFYIHSVVIVKKRQQIAIVLPECDSTIKDEPPKSAERRAEPAFSFTANTGTRDAEIEERDINVCANSTVQTQMASGSPKRPPNSAQRQAELAFRFKASTGTRDAEIEERDIEVCGSRTVQTQMAGGSPMRPPNSAQRQAELAFRFKASTRTRQTEIEERDNEVCGSRTVQTQMAGGSPKRQALFNSRFEKTDDIVSFHSFDVSQDEKDSEHVDGNGNKRNSINSQPEGYNYVQNIKHFLPVMCVTNATTLAFTLVFIYKFFVTVPVDEGLMISLHLIALNSLLSPVMYVLKMKEIRKALKENVNTFCLKISNFF